MWLFLKFWVKTQMTGLQITKIILKVLIPVYECWFVIQKCPIMPNS